MSVRKADRWLSPGSRTLLESNRYRHPQLRAGDRWSRHVQVAQPRIFVFRLAIRNVACAPTATRRGAGESAGASRTNKASSVRSEPSEASLHRVGSPRFRRDLSASRIQSTYVLVRSSSTLFAKGSKGPGCRLDRYSDLENPPSTGRLPQECLIEVGRRTSFRIAG